MPQNIDFSNLTTPIITELLKASIENEKQIKQSWKKGCTTTKRNYAVPTKRIM